MPVTLPLDALSAVGSGRDCLEEFLAARSPVPEHFTYGLTLGSGELRRYYGDDHFRHRVQGAELILGATRSTAWVIKQLTGIRVPVRSTESVIRMMLALSRPTERVLWIGAAPSPRDFRIQIHLGRNPDDVQKWVELIEASSPARFCVLTMDRAELIAHTLWVRRRAKAFALCAGALGGRSGATAPNT
jgi:hypothetical protein